MKAAKLIPIFDELSAIKNKYPKVNCGGCGAVALYISEELNKREIKHEIVWIGNVERRAYKSVIKEIITECDEPTLVEFNDNGIYLSHIMIKVGNYFVDGTGAYKGFQNTTWSHRQIITKLKTKTLRCLVESEEGWNDAFNRNNMPKIKKMVKKTMEKIDK